MLAVKIMPHSGKSEELLAEQGIDKNGIVKKVKGVI